MLHESRSIILFILDLAQWLMSLHESPRQLPASHSCSETCFEYVQMCDDTSRDYCSDTTTATHSRDTRQFAERSLRNDIFSTCCAICHASKFTISKRLKCGHRFCLQCIDAWTQINPSCPLCRESFLVIPWPSICIACGEKDCKNPHIDLHHEIIIEYIEPE